MREALEPFAAMATKRRLEPHPCSIRCWRVGVQCSIEDGVCTECGLRARTDEEMSDARFTESQLRKAAEEIRK